MTSVRYQLGWLPNCWGLTSLVGLSLDYQLRAAFMSAVREVVEWRRTNQLMMEGCVVVVAMTMSLVVAVTSAADLCEYHYLPSNLGLLTARCYASIMLTILSVRLFVCLSESCTESKRRKNTYRTFSPPNSNIAVVFSHRTTWRNSYWVTHPQQWHSYGVRNAWFSTNMWLYLRNDTSHAHRKPYLSNAVISDDLEWPLKIISPNWKLSSLENAAISSICHW